jgi:hypothetical protein
MARPRAPVEDSPGFLDSPARRPSLRLSGPLTRFHCGLSEELWTLLKREESDSYKIIYSEFRW